MTFCDPNGLPEWLSGTVQSTTVLFLKLFLETVDLRGLNDWYLVRNPLSYDYLQRRGVTAVILQLVPSPDGPSTLYKGLVGDIEFQADFKLSHRLVGQNQHASSGREGSEPVTRSNGPGRSAQRNTRQATGLEVVYRENPDSVWARSKRVF